MKIKYLFMSMVMASVALTGFTSCSDDDNDAPSAPEKEELTFSAEQFRVKIGAENRQTIPVATGNGEYNAYSLNPDVADVVVGEDGQVYVEGFKNGTTSIVVSDAAGIYKRVKVNVYTTDILKLNYSALELTTVIGSYNQVSGIAVAEGNGNYSVESSDQRVEASINAETGALNIVASAEENPYSAVVTVYDQTELSTELNVVVSKNTHRVKIGANTREAVPVDASKGEYTVECLSPTTAEIYTDASGNSFIEGKANGVAYINILQGDVFRQYTYSVYTTDELKLNKTTLSSISTLGVSVQNTEVAVTEGNGGYTISSDNSAVSASINRNTGAVTLSMRSKINDYTAKITISDCTGLSATVTVTVKASMEPFSDAEIQNILAQTGSTLYGDCKDPSDGTTPYYWMYYTRYGSGSYYNDTVDSSTHRIGWWFNQYKGGYGGLSVEYPESAQVNEEVTGTLSYMYSSYQWYDLYQYTGTVKVLENNSTRTVVLFWNIDMDNERINRAYFVKYN